MKKLNKKSQAATEHLVTYTWVVLILLVAVAVVSYFGVLDKDLFAPRRCIISPGLTCNDFTIEENTVEIVLTNSLGDNTEIKEIELRGCPSQTPNQIMRSNEKVTFTLSDCCITEKIYSDDLNITYIGESGLEYTVVGEIIGKIQGGICLCNGGAPDGICEPEEDCPPDYPWCPDNKCYEPTCIDSCGETPVREGYEDEQCDNTGTGCTGSSCACDGDGGCLAVTPLTIEDDFESDFGNWVNIAEDDFDWTRNSGGTTSFGTGPSSAHEGSYYVYTEASSPNYPDKTAILQGPRINFEAYTNEHMSFWYHMYGATMGTLYLEEDSTETDSWVELWSQVGQDQTSSDDPWTNVIVDLSGLSGLGRLRFRGVTGSSLVSDMAIDDIIIADGLPLGRSCTKDYQCRSGLLCVDNVCCENTCSGDCRACNIAEEDGGEGLGKCSLAPYMTDPREDCDEDWQECVGLGSPGTCTKRGLPGYCGDKTGECVGIVEKDIDEGNVCMGDGLEVEGDSDNYADLSGFNGCSGACQKKQDTLACDGSGGTSGHDKGDKLTNILAGYICKDNGVETEVSTTDNCGIDNDCASRSCSGTRYYQACDGEGACNNDYAIETTVKAPNNKVLWSDCSVSSGVQSCGGSATCEFCREYTTTSSCLFQFYDPRNNPNRITTVKIGDQCWMKRNMNVGTRVDKEDDQNSIACPSATYIKKWCYDDTASYCDTSNHPYYPDGGLYQWDQAMCGSEVEEAQGICPAGWHIPSDAEWGILVSNLVDGGCEQSMASGWNCDPAGTRIREYTYLAANLAGYRSTSYGGWFYNRDADGYFWSSTVINPDYAHMRRIFEGSALVGKFAGPRVHGYSVRCIKD